MGLPHPLTPTSITSYILTILEQADHTPYIGEPISQLQHSLQCAWLAASASSPPVDEATQIAALLHDIGQFAPEADLINALTRVVSAHASGSSSTSPTSMSHAQFHGIQNMGPSSMESVGRVSHETIGAAYLSTLGFPEKVVRLVEAHVPAKRYLCAVDDGYYARLSETSKKSLDYQGGPMSGSEKDEFGRSQWCADMCRVRQWDDEAKVEALEVPGLETWRAAMERVLSGGK